ncbi:hypothetical protein [Brevundimonas sp.]|uniref:hypothetical protein n=1 Tax=Brevundimonas sp. TaxID=1871086 RepID=UPI0035B2C05E
MLNTPREGASLQVSGGRPSVLANLPSGEQVRTASELLREYNLYGNGGPTIEALWLGFAEHAQRTGRQIKNEDGAWVAWVIKAIDLERAKLGKPPSASRIAGIRRNA